MLVDTHAHLNFEDFDKDREEVIRRAFEGGIKAIINVGTNYKTSKKAVEIAEKYDKGVFAAIGLHPIHTDEGFDYEKYKELGRSKKVVAIGEVGLDYWRKPEDKEEFKIFQEKQKEILLKQLSLANDLNLPVIFHCRKAHDDLIKILHGTAPSKLKGVVHCFTGKWQQAEKYLEVGFYLGFNGIIFKLNLNDVIKKTPLDRILIETDCPFLTPPDFSEKRNNPLGVRYVAQRVAEIKNITFEEVAEKTTKNAEKLF